MAKNWSFKREPAAWVNLIEVGLTAAAAFGLNLTPAQIVAVLGVVKVIGTLVVRDNVFAPVSKDGDKLEAVKYEGQAVEAVK